MLDIQLLRKDLPAVVAGLKRRGFSADQMRNIKNAYRVLYRSELRLEEALAQLKQLGETQPEVALMARFLEASERSITR